jgi:hypothetical protein
MKLIRSLYCLSILHFKFFVFYAVRVTSKESQWLVLSRNSCMYVLDSGCLTVAHAQTQTQQTTCDKVPRSLA